MTRRIVPLALAAVWALTAGCDGLPTGAVATGTGQIRQFVLPPGNPARLELGSARRLICAISASESAGVAYRSQGAGAGGESRFRADAAALLAEPGARQYPRRIQAGGAERETFWINIGDSTVAGDRSRTAVRRHVSPHVYFYTDTEGTTPTDAQVVALAEAFESHIHPSVTGTFGSDPPTDPAGESRLYVVISPAVDNFGLDPGLMGYFWSRDLLSPQGAAANSPRVHSNLKKVIFLTNRLFGYPTLTTYGTLAHEFTHLCVYQQKSLAHKESELSEAPWLDEGWAMLAMDLCGYGLRAGNGEIAKDVKAFLESPAAYSLTDWYHNPNGFSYGQSYLFARYLLDRFGLAFLKEALGTPDVGIGGLQAALAKRGAGFQEVFADWALTNGINGLNLVADGRYNYAADLNLRATYGGVVLNGMKLTALKEAVVALPGTMRPWGTVYYDLSASAPRSWSLDFRNGWTLFGRAVLAP